MRLEDAIYQKRILFSQPHFTTMQNKIHWHDIENISRNLVTYYNILRKTIKGYGFCFDFIPKGIIFSTQIINRYVAEPSLCKDSIKGPLTVVMGAIMYSCLRF